MASDSSTGIVTDAEIEAALTQAETALDTIPSLDDDSGEKIVPIPVQALPQLPQRKVAQPPPAAPVVAPVVAPPQPAATPAEAPAAPTAAAQTAPAATVDVATTKPGRPPLVFRLFDTVLWLLNRPFEWLSPEARGLTGILAIVTIAVSLLALVLLPRLFPPVDLLAELRR